MAGARNVMDPRRARIIGLFSLSHEQNKARFNYAVARKQRRSQLKRMLNGIIFLVAYGKKSLEEIFNKNMAYGQKCYGSTEDTEGTDG